MTNPLDQLREANAERTRGPWIADPHVGQPGSGDQDRANVIGAFGDYAKQCLVRELTTEEGNSTARQFADARFIALSANHMDALLAVVEAAKPFAQAWSDHGHPMLPDDGETLDGFRISDFRTLTAALSRLTGEEAEDG